jgi:PAS domain S-box-containing protein
MISSPTQIDGTEPLVFLVDDDADTRENLRDILEIDGYRIAEAGSARELFALPDWPGVSLILLDRKLPDGEPEQLLPRIKRLAPQASVIIITGFSDVATAVSALRHGAADYIIKPVNADALRASIRREIDRLRSEQKCQALFENALDGFIIFDAAELIIEANPSSCTMLSKTREQLIGQKIISLLPNGSENPSKTTVFSKKNHTGEFRLVRSDGLEIDVEYQTTLNFSPGWNAVSLRDVTERKRSEQRALQAERLAAIGETMAGLVHESRNALQRSFACLEMLELEVSDRPAALNLVARTRKAQDELRQLYEDVREWAAPINLSRQRRDLALVWREAWQHVMQVQKHKHILLQEEISCDPSCRVDALKMGQVFRNLFENAVEVSPEHSHILLTCSLVGKAEQEELRITVRDQGPGITADQASHIFEPFFTTKAKGTGLGLAIAKRIVQAHFGRIAVVTELPPSTVATSTGACLEIILPRGVAS